MTTKGLIAPSEYVTLDDIMETIYWTASEEIQLERDKIPSFGDWINDIVLRIIGEESLD